MSTIFTIKKEPNGYASENAKITANVKNFAKQSTFTKIHKKSLKGENTQKHYTTPVGTRTRRLV